MRDISSLLVILALYAPLPGQALDITHLTGDCYVFTTYQVYKGTTFPANGMYVLTSQGAVLIDSPWDPTQFQPLLDSIRNRHGQKVIMCIATHSHEDRTGGLEFLKQQGVRTYTTRQTDDICKINNQKSAEFLIEKDTVFEVGQHTFQTYYGGPGHTPDNIVVWFGAEKILYGGCLIKSTDATDLGNLNDAKPDVWDDTIRNIKRKFGKPLFIIPGHQSWQSKKALNHTLRLLRQYKRKTNQDE